ncbi:MAG TPA: UDP-N-acetylmuramyl-tripeptide synthetase [Polyangiaceae bacterium]|nr:UDP-N-acetylmuramyl-tripeptide synthetase [Polyangiaceae bacterium]
MTGRLAPASAPYAPWASGLHSIGVTGTNGKTSTTLFVAEVLRAAGLAVASETTIGVGARLGEYDSPSQSTFFDRMRGHADAGVTHLALEVTSEALASGWAKRWRFDAGVFTNLSHDHLNAHGSFEHYLASKAQLFVHLPSGAVAVFNSADPVSGWLERVTPADVRRLYFAAASRGPAMRAADLAARLTHVGPLGTTAELEPSELSEALDRKLEIELLGEVFLENALAAALVAWGHGIEPQTIQRGLRSVSKIPGRFEVIARAPWVVVDYAHTPDALARTLATGRALLADTSGAKLIVVFGAGGDRDANKREAMGVAVGRRADVAILTNDNPRREDPARIAEALARGCAQAGCARVVIELDRARAIDRALNSAGSRDLVLICGKGHERTQTERGITRHFDDAALVRAWLGMTSSA